MVMAVRHHSNTARLREILSENRNRGIGFVPTMGFLHRGHQTLIEASRNDALFTVVSVFVNPAQFGPNEDFDSYPRDPDRDFRLAEESGADLVWYPEVEDLYGAQCQTTVQPGALAKRLCGLSRPQFFPGICTVVLKLFNLVQPTRAYFGEKDFQQLAIIRRMAADFYLDVTVVGCPTIREPDGLAMSSRNARLAPEDRRLALTLYQTIGRARKAFADGARDASAVKHQLQQAWPREIDLDYLEFREPTLLEEVDELTPEVRLFLGAWLKGVRLIDNAALGCAN